MRLTGETPRQQLTLPHAKEPHAWARERWMVQRVQRMCLLH